MKKMKVHDRQSASPRAIQTLEKAERAFGFLPNLLGVLAEAPAALEGYMSVAAAFGSSSLSAAERQVVLLATSVENGCEYCVAAHSRIAQMEKLSAELIAALRDDRPLPDARLRALHAFTVAVVRSRGRVEPDEVEAFLAAGYTRGQILEVVLGVGMKTLSNYTNHLADTPLDEAFRSTAWTKHPAAATA